MRVKVSSMLMVFVCLAACPALAELYKYPAGPVTGEIDVKYTILEKEKGKKFDAAKLGLMASSSKGRSELVNTPDGKRYLKIRSKQQLFNGLVIDSVSILAINEYLINTSFSQKRYSPEGREIEHSAFHFNDPSWNSPVDIYEKSVLPIIFASFISFSLCKSLFSSLESRGIYPAFFTTDLT